VARNDVSGLTAVHRQSEIVLENSISSLISSAMCGICDQRFQGWVTNPDSELAALQGGFFMRACGPPVNASCETAVICDGESINPPPLQRLCEISSTIVDISIGSSSTAACSSICHLCR
jgi:hypothetical protein